MIQSQIFHVTNMSFNVIREIKILAKFSNLQYYLLNGDLVTLTENFIVPLTLSAGCRLLKSSDSETGLKHKKTVWV